MTRFNKKELSFGFIILSAEHNIGRIQGTVRSIRNHYRNVPIICATDAGCAAAELKEIKEVCPTYRGKNTITSLLNTGLKKGHKEWNIVVTEGTWVRRGIDMRYATWVEDEKDVLFSIVVDYNRDMMPVKIYSTFEECSLNGLCIHQKFFKEVGDFSENPLEVSRKLWQLDAIDKGGRFKAILGAKLI